MSVSSQLLWSSRAGPSSQAIGNGAASEWLVLRHYSLSSSLIQRQDPDFEGSCSNATLDYVAIINPNTAKPGSCVSYLDDATAYCCNVLGGELASNTMDLLGAGEGSSSSSRRSPRRRDAPHSPWRSLDNSQSSGAGVSSPAVAGGSSLLVRSAPAEAGAGAAKKGKRQQATFPMCLTSAYSDMLACYEYVASTHCRHVYVPPVGVCNTLVAVAADGPAGAEVGAAEQGGAAGGGSAAGSSGGIDTTAATATATLGGDRGSANGSRRRAMLGGGAFRALLAIQVLALVLSSL